MNVTELARSLRVTPKHLLEKLPEMGFHIGQKAIKVDNRTANQILRDWPRMIRVLEERERIAKEKEKKEKIALAGKKEVTIPRFITVRDFAALAGMQVSEILAELMKNSIFASMNERIDFDTAAIIGADLGLDVKPEETETIAEKKEDEKLKEILKKEKNLSLRPPVIVVMGHVDHGKTKLLDAIRQADVVAGEAGGITQHIGAYQINRKGKTITFIDTPGHEAFTAMRSRGAKVADIAILVVAADDGVKPQTVEAFNIIKAAGLPFVVAMNKVDKEEADINNTKQELSNQLGIIPEDWGGKIVCTPVSAKEGTGIQELLDMLILIAEMETENIQANPNASAVGTVIESRVDKGEGPIATMIVQNGTLRIGDQLCFDGKIFGKARALKDYTGKNINEAAPSLPVKILGLKIAPAVGDILEVGEGERIKGKAMKSTSAFTNVAKPVEENDDKTKKINLLIKSDVLGSAEAIEESLEKINTKEVKTNIIHKGLGNITEGDVARAEATGARIIGFNVKLPVPVEELARTKNVEIKKYNIIYDLINPLKKEIETLTEPKTARIDLGKMKVAAIFRTENKAQIVGGKVIEGKIETDAMIEVLKEKQVVATGKLSQLQSGKQEVKIVEKDQECGIKYEGNPIIEVGDILQFYKEEKITKKS